MGGFFALSARESIDEISAVEAGRYIRPGIPSPKNNTSAAPEQSCTALLCP